MRGKVTQKILKLIKFTIILIIFSIYFIVSHDFCDPIPTLNEWALNMQKPEKEMNCLFSCIAQSIIPLSTRCLKYLLIVM